MTLYFIKLGMIIIILKNDNKRKKVNFIDNKNNDIKRHSYRDILRYQVSETLNKYIYIYTSLCRSIEQFIC